MVDEQGKRMSASLIAWRKSEEWRRIASASALAHVRAFAKLPRCKAKAKRTGCQCRQPAMPNGVCRWHGGRTPSGEKWHQPIFSPGTTPSGTSKLDRKLFDLAKARKERLRLVSKMNRQQREAYEKWHQARDPRLSVRLSRRERKEQAVAAQAIFADPGGDAIAPEILEIEEKIRILQLEVDRRSARAEQDYAASLPTTANEGIFG